MNISIFCIPAHGHTNPMLPVAKELKIRGNNVRFYSFEEFREKIEKTGAEFIPYDAFLPKLSAEQEARLKKISTTEMSMQDLEITRKMSGFLDKEAAEFKPDVIYTDSVCFWGKLTAKKHGIPMVVSTSTFAFNQFSSQYMKYSPKEMADLMFGLPKLNKELKKLEPYGYNVNGILSIVQNDNDTDSIVYTSRRFQPYSKTFSKHYLFAGPSVFSDAVPDKKKSRPLIYISMGTVINDRPDFYKKCIEALKNENADVIISCGNYMDIRELGTLPENIKVYPYVDQLDVLSRADAFITHCGMNSVSESLYMATPMILYPQTSEQCAVARRAKEIGAGLLLKDDSINGIAKAVRTVLNNKPYAEAALECSNDFRSSPGVAAAAEFIETAPHSVPKSEDPVNKLNAKIGLWQLLYWVIAIALMILCGKFAGTQYIWILGVAAGVFNQFFTKFITQKHLKKL